MMLDTCAASSKVRTDKSKAGWAAMIELQEMKLMNRKQASKNKNFPGEFWRETREHERGCRSEVFSDSHTVIRR